jgi:hypothetical protein
MPIAISRDDARARLTAVASGELTLAELVAFIKTERAGPLVRYALLFDLRAATMNFTQQHVGALADVVGSIKVRFGERAPVAIVASSDPVFGLMRMYQTLCEIGGVQDIGVFRDLLAAEVWLSTSKRAE